MELLPIFLKSPQIFKINSHRIGTRTKISFSNQEEDEKKNIYIYLVGKKTKITLHTTIVDYFYFPTQVLKIN